MQHYEMLFILPMSFTPDQVTEQKEKIKEILLTNGAQITFEEDMGKLKFAYQIDKMSHGFYILLEFDLDPISLKKLEQPLKLKKELVRFLIVKKPIKSVEQIAKEKEIKEKIAQKQEEEKVQAEKDEKKEKESKKEAKKLDLEDLDKKLEEILDAKDII